MDAAPLLVEVEHVTPYWRGALTERVLVSNGERLYRVVRLLVGAQTVQLVLCRVGPDGADETLGYNEVQLSQAEQWDAVLAARVRATLRLVGLPAAEPSSGEV